MRATKKERGPPKSLTSVFPSNPSSEPQRKSRRPFSPEGKKKVEAVRSVGACVQCRTRKRTVSYVMSSCNCTSFCREILITDLACSVIHLGLAIPA